MANRSNDKTLSDLVFDTQEWEMDPQFAPILISMGSVVVSVGLVSNILLIVSIWRTPSLRTSANIIVVFMCAVDLCRILHLLVINLFTGIFGRWLYDHTTTCTYSAFISDFVGKVTGFSLGVISLNRLLMITKHELYRKVFRVRNTIVILSVVILVNVACSLPVTIDGLGIYVLYSDQSGSCYVYDASPKKAFQLTNICFGIILPSAVMIPSYSWIVYYVRRSKRRVNVGNITRPSPVSLKDEIRSALIIFLTYITYFLFYVPIYAAYLAFVSGVRLPGELLVASSLLSEFHRFIRPCLYLIVGISYRKAIVQLFRPSTRQPQTGTAETDQQQTKRTNGSTGNESTR